MNKNNFNLIRILLLWVSILIGTYICFDKPMYVVSMMNLTFGIPVLFYFMFVVIKKNEPYIIFTLFVGIPMFIFMVLDVIFITITGKWNDVLK